MSQPARARKPQEVTRRRFANRAEVEAMVTGDINWPHLGLDPIFGRRLVGDVLNSLQTRGVALDGLIQTTVTEEV